MMGGPRSDGQRKPLHPGTAKRVVRAFVPYKAQLVWTVLAVLVSSALGLLSPFYLRTIVNQGLLGHDLGVVTRYTIYTLAATIGGTAAALGYGYLSVVVGQDIMRDLRNQLYDHLQGMSLRFFTGTRTGEIQSRLTNDVGSIQSIVTDTASSLLSNVVTLLSTVIAMLVLSWQLTVLSLFITPLFVLYTYRAG